MKIKFFSNLRDIIGSDVLELDIESPISLKELLNSISASYGEMARQYLLKPTGQIADHLLISINGNIVHHTQNVYLQNEDNLTIVPALAGG